MLMWYIIFVILIVSAAACLLYLSSRVAKFNFAAKIAPFKSKRRLLMGFIVTSGLSDWSIKFKTGTKSEFVIINLKSE